MSATCACSSTEKIFLNNDSPSHINIVDADWFAHCPPAILLSRRRSISLLSSGRLLGFLIILPKAAPFAHCPSAARFLGHWSLLIVLGRAWVQSMATNLKDDVCSCYHSGCRWCLSLFSVQIVIDTCYRSHCTPERSKMQA